MALRTGCIALLLALVLIGDVLATAGAGRWSLDALLQRYAAG